MYTSTRGSVQRNVRTVCIHQQEEVYNENILNEDETKEETLLQEEPMGLERSVHKVKE